MMLLGPRGNVIPAQTIIESDVGPNAPAVLCENAAVRGALVECRGRLLRVEIGKPEQKVGEAVAGGLIAAAEEGKCSIGNQVRILFHLVPDVFETCLERMIASDLGNSIARIKRIVDLGDKERLRAGRK